MVQNIWSIKLLLNDNDVVISLCIKLAQMIGYPKCIDSKNAMYFKVGDKITVKKVLRNLEKS